MKHAQTFTAAHDALATLTAQPERLDTDPQAIGSALSLTAAALLDVLGEASTSAGEMTPPPSTQPLDILTAARDALSEYAARELPAPGTPERLSLLTTLSAALSVLELLDLIHDLSG